VTSEGPHLVHRRAGHAPRHPRWRRHLVGPPRPRLDRLLHLARRHRHCR